jgi:hypothetical protein
MEDMTPPATVKLQTLLPTAMRHGRYLGAVEGRRGGQVVA